MRIPKYITKDATKKTYTTVESNPRYRVNNRGRRIRVEQYKGIFAYRNSGGGWVVDTEHYPTRSEAKEWTNSKIREHEKKGFAMEHSGLTLARYARDTYIPDFVDGLASSRTEKKYIETAIGFFGDNALLDSIRPIQLRRYKKHLEKTCGKFRGDGVTPMVYSDGDRKGQPMTRSARAVNAHLVRLRALFNQAAADEVIATAPSFAKLIETSKETSRKLTIELDEHERLLSVCDEADKDGNLIRGHLKLILIGLHELGCRRAELHQIRVSDIDLDAGHVKVWEAKRKVRVQRETPITETFRTAIRNYCIMEQPSKSLVFGEYLDLKRSWNTAKRLAKVRTQLNLNDYRHTAISNAHEAGATKTDIQLWYGHSTKSKITESVYINPRPDYVRAEILKIDAYMQRKRDALEEKRKATAKEVSDDILESDTLE